MNQSASTIRCPHCDFLNFASEPFCKRCKNSLQNTAGAGESNSININITLPTGVQPRINAQPEARLQNNLYNGQTPSASFDRSSEYRLQNQTGFEQWQQANAQANQQSEQRLNPHFIPQQFSAPVFAPPNGYPMHSPVVWRRGDELIVHRYAATLPDRCVKCNDSIGDYASGNRIRQKFRWHNPLVYIALVSPLVYVILSLVLSQHVQFDVSLCRRHLDERQSAGKTLLAGGAAAALAIFFFASFGYVGFSFLLFLGALIGIIYGYEYSYKPLRIAKIENDYVYLKNADDEFLSNFPNC